MNKIDLKNIAELQKIALSDEKIEGIKVKHDFLSFLSFFKVEPGRFKIKRQVLYGVYKNWSKDPKSLLKFSAFLNKVLESRTEYYLINISAIKIQQSLYEFLNSKSRNVIKVKNYKAHFDSFIKWVGFKSGDFYIKESSVFWLYDRWTYQRKTKRILSESELLKFCRLYFPLKKLKDGNYLGINQAEMRTTIEQLQFASKWNEIRNEKKGKRKS